MYHRQIFKLLLSSKVLDDPRQRKLFKTSDLVELFHLNESTEGETSESDRLFRESKLTPGANSFSLSKIEKMRKLASVLSKKISATNSIVKPTCDEGKKTSDDAHETEHDEKNNNLRSNEAPAAEHCSSENQTLNSQQIGTQASPGEGVNSLTDTGRTNGNAEDNGTSKDDSELDAAPTNTTNDSLVKKKENKSVLSDDKVESSHTRKRKKSKKKDKGNVSAMFEGERVSCLIGRRLGRSDERKPVLTTDDDYVLKKLFAKSSNYYFNVVLSNSV